MSVFENDGTIYTDESGRPIPRPEAPPEGAGIEDRIAFIDALHAYHNKVTDIANRAFDEAFRKALRR